MSFNPTLTFPDLIEREQAERSELQARADRWTRYPPSQPSDKAEFQRIQAVLKLADEDETQCVDPLFVATRDLLVAADGLFDNRAMAHDDAGALSFEPPVTGGKPAQFRVVTRAALALGLLATDQVEAPRVVVGQRPGTDKLQVMADDSDPRYRSFSAALFKAMGEVNAAMIRPPAVREAHSLAEVVLSRLEDEGDVVPGNKTQGSVRTGEFAQVVRCLVSRNIRVDQPVQLRREINECLDRIQRVGSDRPMAEQGISLPLFNSENAPAFQINPEHVRLCAVPICVTMFETLKVYQVVDRLVEMAQDGTLVLDARSEAGEMLYRYWKDTPNRINESERRRFIAQSIGVPGGDTSGPYNRECNDLWSRLVSSVSEFMRQLTADKMLRAAQPSSVRQQQVRKAARDLALNLSSHTFGMSRYLALDLQSQINLFVKLLGHKDVMACFGAQNMWQVIDQVAQLELGGALNSSRYATLATCGAIITAWLANNVHLFNSTSSRPILKAAELLMDEPPTAADATKNPTDYDFVNACELWAIEMSFSGERVEELAQPHESPVMTSRPVPIPAVARELLDQSDLSGLGLGLRH